MSWLFLTAVLLHPVHETLSELEWNPESRRVEVALRLSVIDEEWIVRHHGPLPKAAEAKAWYQDLLRRQMRFDPPSDKEAEAGKLARPIHWVGRKDEGAHVWWFFEVGGDKTPPTSLRMSLLFDREKNYRHRVVLLGKKRGVTTKHRSVEIRSAKPQAELDLIQ